MMDTQRNRWNKAKALLGPVAVAALLLAACAGGTQAPADVGAATTGAEEATTGTGTGGAAAPTDLGAVNVGLSVPESELFLPADMGPELEAFEDCGIEVNNIVGESSTVGRALAAGEVDITLQAGTRAVAETMQGIPARLVAGQSNPWSQVLVVSDELAAEGLETVEDVRSLGEEFGTLSFGISSFGSAGHLSVLSLAEELGWTEGQEYEIVPLGGVNEITAGLESGAVNAFTWSRGVAAAMEEAGVGHIIDDIVAEAVGPTIFEVFVASDRIIEERPEALKAYLECYFAFTRELKDDPERVRELAIERWNKDPQALDAVLDQIINDWNPDGSASQEELQGLSEDAIFQSDGEIEEAPVDVWWRYWQDL